MMTSISLIQLISVFLTTLNLAIILTNAAPSKSAVTSKAAEAAISPSTTTTTTTTTIANTKPTEPLVAINSQQKVIASLTNKTKRDSHSQAAETSLELDTQETFLPGSYNKDTDYGYDSGKNSYGKQASDWSLYDQGEFLFFFFNVTYFCEKSIM